MRNRVLVLLLASLCPVGADAADESDRIDYTTARLERRLPAVLTAGPIEVDGRLDEPGWRDAPVATNFIQNEPREGEPASEQTEVRLLYDEGNLYIGVFARDREAHRVIVNDLKKDFNRESNDTFEVVLDTFRDERNGYMFAVNALGARWDAQMVNEGRETNANWDGIWTVRTRLVEEGWYAEIAIPFRTLKFPESSPQTWGINFMRQIRRRNEDTFWSPLPRIYQLSRVSLAGTLEGLQGVRPGNNLRVKPYVLGSTGAIAGLGTSEDADVGVDVKYGVTSSLTWDFTLNTDFSQVEADEQQINLTRFSLFFPEKRDFFLENSGVFQFGGGDARGGGGGGGVGGGGGRPNALRQDFIPFFSRRIGLSSEGEPIPILGGTRLTGRAGRYTLGALNIQQRALGASRATNFTALRLRRDILANSDIGLMALNRDQSGSLYNRVVGTDLNFRFFTNLNINGFVVKSWSPQSVVGGPGRNTASRAGFSYRDRFWELRAAQMQIGERFNDEMGFVPRTGVHKTEAYAGTHIRIPKWAGWLRETFPHWEFSQVYRASGGLDSRYSDYHLPLTLQNSSFIELGSNPTVERLIVPFKINSRRNISIAPGRYDFTEHFILWRSNQSAPVSFNGRYALGDFYDGYKHTYEIGGRTRVNERLNLSGNLSINRISLAAGAYTTNLITSRIDYSFSTRTFVNALLQYNTDARQWSSNVRFNIIHRPLSDFFLVYNERRDSRSGDLINRALVAKLTYLVAF